MAVTKSSAVIAFAAAAVATTTFAIPHQAAAAPSPAPSASVHSDSGQSARNRYPHGLRHEAVTEPSRRPARTRLLASTAVSAVQVVIDILDRNGKAPATDDADGVLFYPLDGSDPFYGELDRGHLEGQLPAGQYAVVAYVKTPEGDGDASTSVVYRPRVLVQDATKLVLDAREARPVSVSVDRADARTLDGAVRITQRLGGAPAVTVWGIPLKNSYVTPTAPEKDLDFTVQAVITRNGAQFGSPYVYNVVAAQHQRIPTNPEFRVKTADMAEVAVRYGTEGRPVCTGGHAGPAWAEGGGIGFFSGVGAAPATRTEYYSPGVEWDVDWMNTTPYCGFEFDQTEFWSRTVRFSKPGTHRWNLTPAPFGPPSLGHLGQRTRTGTGGFHALDLGRPKQYRALYRSGRLLRPAGLRRTGRL